LWSIAFALALALLTLRELYRRIARPVRDVGVAVRSATDDLTLPPIAVTGPQELASLVADIEQFVDAARREREATARVFVLEQQLRHAERVHEHERELRLLDDRERIGRDLHDTVIQRLFATGLTLESLSNRVDDPAIRARLASAVDELDATIREVRSAIFALERGEAARPRDAFVDLAQDVTPTLGFAPAVEFVGPVDTEIPSHVADQMLATMREALTNVARHAGASHAEVSVAVEDEIVLRVSDNGSGFRTDEAARAGGLGLSSMRARAERLGGALRVESSVAGTIVEWRAPRATTGG
jgi:signal transduction histidine kinase